jgi:hypothetical protein
VCQAVTSVGEWSAGKEVAGSESWRHCVGRPGDGVLPTSTSDLLYLTVSPFLAAFAELREVAISFVVVCVCVCLSVRPHGTTRLLLDGFS